MVEYFVEAYDLEGQKVELRLVVDEKGRVQRVERVRK